MLPRRPRAAFSLLEVTFALAVVAVGLTSALALASRATHSLNLAREYRATVGLLGDLEAALLADAAREGIASLAASFPSSGPAKRFLAGADGAQLSAAEAWPTGSQAYYGLEVWRLQGDPLAYNAGDQLLVLRVVVAWPTSPGTPQPATTGSQAAGSAEFLLPLRP